MKNKISILIAKPGLDGHDKGAKVISFALKDAGMNVVYSGLHKSLDEIIEEAVKKSVDVIGLSIMTGSHLFISKRCLEILKKQNNLNIKLVVGGVIPKKDIKKLLDIGVDGVFPNGTKFDLIVDSIRSLF